MAISGSLLLPKLSELNGLPDSIVQLYLDVQCNNSIDALWEGVAVIVNTGAADYIKEHGKNSGWFSSFEKTEENGGIENRIGIITQYEDLNSVTLQNNFFGMDLKPWVRISCFMESQSLGSKREICQVSSVSLDARFCTTIPMYMLIEARKQTVKKDADMSKFIEEFIQG
jgi:hypothetical protein